MDLMALLPEMLPKVIAWAEQEAQAVVRSGRPLAGWEAGLARRVGVAQPERIRVAIVDALPLPPDPDLRNAALQVGLLGSGMAGLTLGHSVFVCRGHETPRLLAHEFRHVHQYEQAGGLSTFLPVYLQEIVQVGYANSSFEKDARAHEG